MALSLNTALKNKILDGIGNSGAGINFDSGVLEIRSGTRPADANTALAGSVLATVNLPADAFAVAASGAMAKSGTWQDPAADASGTASYFTMRDSTSTYRIDGDVGVGAGDLQVDSVSFTAGQQFTITGFTLSV